MGYSLCMMADFQNVSFLEYLVFFWHKTMDFDKFFGILIFDPK